jgi:hypothetical protein
MADRDEPSNKLCLWEDGTLNISSNSHILLCRTQALALANALASWALAQPAG